MRVVVFANGELRDLAQARAIAELAEMVIAADGGTRHARAVGVVPQVLIGDQDSLSTEECERARRSGTRVITFAEGKDQTDLELALLHASQQGATSISVVAALGGRIDQMIANILLMALPQLRGIDVRIVDGHQTAFLIRAADGKRIVEGEQGDTVSLIPIGGDVSGVTAQGLEWPLCGSTLRFGPARGVSNVLNADHATIRVETGCLLCVVMARGSALARGVGGAE
jgi:thiamine pyrophosphokinase